MEVIINQQTFSLKSNALTEALKSYGLTQTKGIAVAVNDTVIPKTAWEAFQVKAQDQITIITAAQGG